MTTHNHVPEKVSPLTSNQEMQWLEVIKTTVPGIPGSGLIVQRLCHRLWVK